MGLESVHIFKGLAESALKYLTERAEIITPKGLEIIVYEGERGNRMFVIEAGQVRACRNFAKAGEAELARLGPGECFGEMCILDTLPRSATVQATQDSTLYSLDNTALYGLYQQHPAQFSAVLLNIARELSRRLRQLDKTFASWQ